MKMQRQTHSLKDGRTAHLRPLEPSDAEAALAYINCVTAETDYLALESGELDLSVEQERRFIENNHTGFYRGELDGPRPA